MRFGRGSVAAAAGLMVALSACGGNASPSTASASHGGSATASAVAEPPAGQLLTRALTNLSKAPYIDYTFVGLDRYGPGGFTLVSDGKGDLSGTITTQGLTTSIVDLDKDSELYIEGTPMAALTPNSDLPANLPATDWVELLPQPDGFFDALATTSMLQQCITNYGRESLSDTGVGKVDGVKVYLVKNTVDSPDNATATAGSYAITATGPPVLVAWTMTADYGVESPACPAGPQAGASPGLLLGTLTLSAPASAPTIAAPVGTIYQEPGRDYTGGGYGP